MITAPKRLDFQSRRGSQFRSQDGLMTIDFVFAMTLVLVFTVLLYSFSLTLSVVELVQYITFSTARAAYAAHVDLGSQVQLGTKKYNELVGRRAIAPLFKSWFKLNGGAGLGDWNHIYPQRGDDSRTFWGSRIQFLSPVLKFNIPLLGSSTEDDSPPAAFVSSYLSREPTSEECLLFNAQRAFAIKNLNISYRLMDEKSYFVMADNGC